MLSNRLGRKLIVVLGIVIIAACSGEEIANIPPEEIISISVVRMRAMPGFSFLIDRSGAFAFLDPQETISFSRAEGKYVAPDMVDSRVKVIVPGIVAEVKLISIGDNQWQTNLLTGEWEVMQPGFSFNPSVLFHPDTGIQAALANDLSELEYISIDELEEAPGQQLYKLTGKLKGARAYQMSFGLIGPDELLVTLWIQPVTFELHRLVVVEVGINGEEDTEWIIDFWDFDQIIAISNPIP